MAWPNLLRLVYRNIRVNTDAGSLIILVGLPAMYLVFFGFGFQSVASGADPGLGGGYLRFLGPGIMSFQAVMAGTVGGSMLWADRRWGMLAQLLVGPFTRLQYLLGIMVTSLLFGLVGALVMLGASAVLLGGALPGVLAVLAMLGVIGLGSLFFGSLMLLISALVKSNNAYNSIQILVLFLVNFASTVFYPLSPQLPGVLKVLFLVNPLTYIANNVRGVYLSSLNGTDLLELGVLAAETVVLLYLASRAYLRSSLSLD
jgi:ABC-2 type transport system permease protein